MKSTTDGIDGIDVFHASGHRWRSSSMRLTTDVPSELLDPQVSPKPPSSYGKRVHGVIIPPLNLRGASRQTDTSGDGPLDPHPHQHSRQPSSSSRRTTATNSAAQPATPDRHPGIGGDASGDSRHRQSYGAWYLPTKDWKTVHEGPGGAARCSSSSSTVAEAPAAAAAPPLPTVYVPDGVESALTEEELANREAMALELGTSYTARAYKEHLRAHNLRPPAVLEQIPSPTEEQLRQHQLDLARAAAAAHVHTPPPPPPPPAALASTSVSAGVISARQSVGVSSARQSNGDARSAGSTATGAVPAPPLAAVLSARTSSTPVQSEGRPFPPPPLILTMTPSVTPPGGQSLTGQASPGAGPPGIPQDTPRSVVRQLSARSVTSDGRLGTAQSSMGAVGDLELEATAAGAGAAAAPPPPTVATAVTRGADGIETLDEVMAPALRERIRQLLSAQDALLAHQARMKAYEEERDRINQARAAANAQQAAAPAAGGRRANLRTSRPPNGRGAARNGRNGRSSRSRSPSRSPSPGPLLSGTVLASAATAGAAGAAAGAPGKAGGGDGGAATSAGPLHAVKSSLPTVLSRVTALGAADSGPLPSMSRPGRPTGLQASRSLKRVQLVTTKKDKSRGRDKGKDKDKRKDKTQGKKGGKARGKGSSSRTSNSSGSSSSSSSSSSSATESSSSSSSDSDSDKETNVGGGGGGSRPPPSAEPSSSDAVPPGPFASATGAVAAATATAASATAPAAAAAAATAAATEASAGAAPRAHEGSNTDASLTPQASSALVPAATSHARSYGGGSGKPGRSSMRASIPQPKKIVLPGPSGDLNHLMLLLEKLPSRVKSVRSKTSGAPAAPTSSMTGGGWASPPLVSSSAMHSVTAGGAAAAVAAAGPSGTAGTDAQRVSDVPRNTSPDHRRKLSLQLQALLQTPRSTSPNGRFAYGVGEPNVWGENVVQAALGGFPSGAAAALLARCEERQPGVHRGGPPLSPVASSYFATATAEPSVLVVLPAADRRQAPGSAPTAVPATEAAEEPATEAAAAEPSSAPASPPQPPPAAATAPATAVVVEELGTDGDDEMPLAVQVMMGVISEYDLMPAPSSSSGFSSQRAGLGLAPLDNQRSAAGPSMQQPYKHHHHHRHHHHYHHRHHHRQGQEPQDLHDLHERDGTQLQHLQRNRHHHHHHHQGVLPDLGADPSSCPSEGSRASSPAHLAGGGGSRWRAISYTGGGSGDESGPDGGVGGSDGGGPTPRGDAAWRALRERRRLPPEASLPARVSGWAPAAREGGGAHSFAPEQVAVLAGARGALSGSEGRISGSGAAAPSHSMPPLLRAPLPPPALAGPLLGRGGGGALLPGISSKAAAAAAAAAAIERDSDRGLTASGAAGVGSAAASGGNSPIYELYALGLIPNPSLLRASMAAARPVPAPRRRQLAGITASFDSSRAAAAAAAAAAQAFGDLPRRIPDPSTAISASFPSSTSGGLPYHMHRHDFSTPVHVPASLALHRRATGAAAAAGNGGFGGGGGESFGLAAIGGSSGLLGAPPSPAPSLYVHTHPHVAPGSVVQVAEAAEAEAMTARSRMGRTSPLDLQHMLGVDVPPPMLQAR